MTDAEIKCSTCFGSGVAGTVVAQMTCPMCKGGGYVTLDLLSSDRLEELRDYVRNAKVGSRLMAELLIHIDAQAEIIKKLEQSILDRKSLSLLSSLEEPSFVEYTKMHRKLQERTDERDSLYAAANYLLSLYHGVRLDTDWEYAWNDLQSQVDSLHGKVDADDE